MSLTWGRVAGLLAVVVVTGCSGGESLPDGRTVLRDASAAMRGVQSVGFAIRSEGNPQLAVKSADGQLLRSGDAQGTLQLNQSGQTVEMAFTLVGNTVYFKGATGGYQKLPKVAVLAVYDPSAILDPQRGIVKLLNAATKPETEKREKVAGQQTLRVKATLPKAVVPALVPGVTKDVDGQVWVAESDHKVLKVRLPIQQGAVIVTFSDFNRNFVIAAPKG